MTPEEYQRIKEAEKEHLRALKKLKDAVRLLERRKSVNQALTNMATGARDTLDLHDEMIDKLAVETARQEARLEIALENSNLEAGDLDEAAPGRAAAAPLEDTPDRAAEAARATEAFEDELLKERAKTLLRQIKVQMGAPPENAGEAQPAPTKRAPDKATPENAENPPPPADRPEKTIGRMK